MRAFLSHSSLDKGIVIAVHNALEKDATWLDRAEIEWGDLFLEKLADGIRSSTDFVLFWSASAAKSGWVRLEINMAFIQALRQKAIRLRVVDLDGTPLPLYLQPFHAFSTVGSPNPVEEIVKKLSPLLRQPVRSARARFVNRNDEIAKIEDAVDDSEIFGIFLFGFTGVGKASLVQEALRRIFEGASLAKIDITEGTGPVELALTLNALAGNEMLAESLPHLELERQIRLSIEILAREGRLIVVSNVQHWLDEDGAPQDPLLLLLSIVGDIEAFAQRPVFFTSTRRPHLDPAVLKRISLMSLKGLTDDHIAVLVRNWYFMIHDQELSPEDASKIAPKLFGHPVAARLVAGLLGDHSVDYLERYPRELISLRRDLARTLLQDLKLGPPAERLMETLALAGIPLAASTVAADGFSDDEFQQAVEQCARAGLITADTKIQGHPLFQEFFWHRLHRSDYQERARTLASTVKKHLSALSTDSLDYAELLPVTFRLFALSGDLSSASALRRDLSGELEAAAITLYNRRNYLLAEKYIDHILDGDPNNWRVRLYKARIRARQEEWAQADDIINQLLKERPGDIAALHVRGWRLMREGRLPEALAIFAGIVSRREHVVSLRDAAECLHRLKRNPEALKFLARAKAQESENPFVLDLESRILEDMDELQPAYESALLASARDPLNGHLHHRLGQICTKQGKLELAIPHFQKSIEIDSDQFNPVSSLASAYLDIADVESAEQTVENLRAKARTPADRSIVEHIKARIAFAKGDLQNSEQILKLEIQHSRNLVPNLGLFVQVELALFDRNIAQFPTIADVALNSAEQALAKIIGLDPDNRFAEKLRAAVTDRRKN